MKGCIKISMVFARSCLSNFQSFREMRSSISVGGEHTDLKRGNKLFLVEGREFQTRRHNLFLLAFSTLYSNKGSVLGYEKSC